MRARRRTTEIVMLKVGLTISPNALQIITNITLTMPLAIPYNRVADLNGQGGQLQGS